MPNKEVEVVKIKVIPVPNYSIFGGCGNSHTQIINLEPWFRISNNNYEYNSKVRSYIQ